ncbi:hypothetical protein [Oceanobacter kriegii]|uniref:hypothetical protein n=1 Tax=Oceanobacter kriegii TaxID=64972 RepID=UPI001B7F854D|nr:hypothetical protein [Oceanobacter kriegii]
MKLPVTCAQCMQEDIANAMITATVEFRDDGRYEINCPKGHSSVTLLQQQKFEVLFDIGAYAILDGYYREAVSSFTSSLERFYEFFIKVVCLSKGIDWDKTQEAWKEVSNQSERQLGAFIFLHLQETGNKPTLLSNSKIKFRNEVIHKGKIPSKEQAIQYGQAVLDVIRPLLNVLKTEYSEAVGSATFRHLSNTRTPSDVGMPVATMCISTIISLSNGEPSHDQRGLEEALAQLRRW